MHQIYRQLKRAFCYLLVLEAGAHVAFAKEHNPEQGYVGLAIGTEDRTAKIVVIGVGPGSSAELNGIKYNDEIVSVNGSPVQGLSDHRVRDLLVGPVGTTVTVSVVHDHAKLRDLELNREPFNKASGRAYLEAKLNDAEKQKVSPQASVSLAQSAGLMGLHDLQESFAKIAIAGIEELQQPNQRNDDACQAFLELGFSFSTRGMYTEAHQAYHDLIENARKRPPDYAISTEIVSNGEDYAETSVRAGRHSDSADIYNLLAAFSEKNIIGGANLAQVLRTVI